MNERRLPLTLVASVVSYGSTALVALLLTPFLVSRLGKEVYSFYPLSNTFVIYVGVLGIALNSMAARFVTVSVARNDTIKANIYFSSVLRANLILIATLTPVFVVLVVNLGNVLSIPPESVGDIRTLFGLVFVGVLIRIGASTLGIATFATNRLDLRAWADICLSTVRALAYLALFSLLEPSIVYVGIVAIIVEVASLGINFGLTRHLMPGISFFGVPFEFSAVRTVLSSGIWNSIRQVGAILLSAIALMLSNVFLGPGSTGNFAIALTIPTFVAGLVATIGSVYVPTTTRMFATGSTTSLIQQIGRAQLVSGWVASVTIGVFVGSAGEFFAVWVPGEDQSLLALLATLTIVHLVFTGATWPVSNLNVAMNRVRAPAIAMIIGGFASLAIAVACLRLTDWGLIGLAGASLLPNLILVLVFVPLYPCRELGLSWWTFYPAVFRSIAAFGGTASATFGLVSWIDPVTWVGLVWVWIAAGACGMVISMLSLFGPRGSLRFMGRRFI